MYEIKHGAYNYCLPPFHKYQTLVIELLNLLAWYSLYFLVCLLYLSLLKLFKILYLRPDFELIKNLVNYLWWTGFWFDNFYNIIWFYCLERIHLFFYIFFSFLALLIDIKIFLYIPSILFLLGFWNLVIELYHLIHFSFYLIQN